MDELTFSLENLTNSPDFDFLHQLHNSIPSDDANDFNFNNFFANDSPYFEKNLSCTYLDEKDFCNLYSNNRKFSLTVCPFMYRASRPSSQNLVYLLPNLE